MKVLNVKLASDIATSVLGQPVYVLLELLPDGQLGEAWQTPSGDLAISVTPFCHPERQVRTFLHEVRHHQRGDVKRPRHLCREDAGADLTGEVRAMFDDAISKMEADCNEFADRQLAALTPDAWSVLLVDR